MRILIIGLGSIAQKHILAINSLGKKFEIYALRSKLESENSVGINNIFNLEEINKFHFAIISNPTFLHEEFIIKLLKKKIPLFIEKPVLHTLQNINYILNEINKNTIRTYVACNLRFHPCIIFLKNYLKMNKTKINECNVYCGSFLPNWRTNKDFRSIYSANAAMGGGVHLDLFHEIDYTVWLFGLPINSTSILRNVSSLNISAIDYANFNLEYKDFSVNIILNYYRKSPKRVIELVLENDILTIDLIKNNITTDTGEILFSISNFNIQQTYNDQIEYFIYCLENNINNMNTVEESASILKLVLKND